MVRTVPHPRRVQRLRTVPARSRGILRASRLEVTQVNAVLHRYSIHYALVAALSACSASEGTGGESTTFPAEPLTTVPSDADLLRVAVRTAPSQPPSRGPCSVELTIQDASGATKDGLVLDAVPFMPSHGHGASVRPTVEAKGEGIYLLHNVTFYMPGDWQL